MTRRAAQLNIRSDAARQRVAELVAETGKSATQVVEEALQTYRPPPSVTKPTVPDGFEIKGRILVQKESTARTTSIDEILNAIEESRDRPLFLDNDRPN